MNCPTLNLSGADLSTVSNYNLVTIEWSVSTRRVPTRFFNPAAKSYDVKVRYAGREMTVPFYTGSVVGHPIASEVLDALCMDASSVEEADDMWAWFDEQGVEPSREGEDMYTQVMAQTAALRVVFGDMFDTIVFDCDPYERAEYTGEWQVTDSDLHEWWRAEILPAVVSIYERDGVPDLPARSESFANWVDALASDGEITELRAYHLESPPECG